MKTEYEVRILEINEKIFREKIEAQGAQYIGEWMQKRYCYDMKPVQEAKWLRLRTTGEETTLTIKDIQNKSISGTKEIEIEVSDFETTNTLLEHLGYFARSVQENKRTRYILDDVEIDIDTWPHIPTYVELEGKDDASILKLLEKLGYQESDVVTLDVEEIYEHYGYTKEDMNDLKFEEA